MEVLKKILKAWPFAFILGLLIGVLVLLAVRFITYKPDSVHYHANFAVYINGQREEFKGPQYYEEFSTASCSSDGPKIDPRERVHMHGNINDVVHVHDDLVTWGNFFQNLGWGISDNYLAVPDTIYQNNDQAKLTFVLNGKQIDSIANKIINDRDRLLISYGNNTQQSLDQQFKTVASSAQKYDESKDTAACGSNAAPTTRQRLNHLI